jgi:mRNA interferase MazF
VGGLRRIARSVAIYHRPIAVIQSDFFNRTRINTLIVAKITTNLRLAKMPGNILLSKRASGLEEESVVNITQLFTVDRSDLLKFVGAISERKMEQIDEGLRLVLSL